MNVDPPCVLSNEQDMNDWVFQNRQRPMCGKSRRPTPFGVGCGTNEAPFVALARAKTHSTCAVLCHNSGENAGKHGLLRELCNSQRGPLWGFVMKQTENEEKRNTAGPFVAGAKTNNPIPTRDRLDQELEKLRTIRVLKRLPCVFGKGERLPDGLEGAEIIRIGGAYDRNLVEGGGLVIDYKPSGSTEVRRVVLAYNDGAMYVAGYFSGTQ